MRALVASPVHQVSFTNDIASYSQINNARSRPINVSDICLDSPSCHSCTNFQVSINEQAHVIADLKKRVFDLDKNLLRRPKSMVAFQVSGDSNLFWQKIAAGQSIVPGNWSHHISTFVQKVGV